MFCRTSWAAVWACFLVSKNVEAQDLGWALFQLWEKKDQRVAQWDAFTACSSLIRALKLGGTYCLCCKEGQWTWNWLQKKKKRNRLRVEDSQKQVDSLSVHNNKACSMNTSPLSSPLAAHPVQVLLARQREKWAELQGCACSSMDNRKERSQILLFKKFLPVK